MTWQEARDSGGGEYARESLEQEEHDDDEGECEFSGRITLQRWTS